jgi:hypothetical protein
MATIELRRNKGKRGTRTTLLAKVEGLPSTSKAGRSPGVWDTFGISIRGLDPKNADRSVTAELSMTRLEAKDVYDQLGMMLS